MKTDSNPKFIPKESICDERGELLVTNLDDLNHMLYCELIVSKNYSANTWRGYHWQSIVLQKKYIKVTNGRILDFALCMDVNSKEYRKVKKTYVGMNSGDWYFIPENYAHGFLTLCDNTIVEYCIFGKYDNANSVTIRRDDPFIQDDFEFPTNLISSAKDNNAPNYTAE